MFLNPSRLGCNLLSTSSYLIVMLLSGLYRSLFFSLERYIDFYLNGSAAMTFLDCSIRMKYTIITPIFAINCNQMFLEFCVFKIRESCIISKIAMVLISSPANYLLVL